MSVNPGEGVIVEGLTTETYSSSKPLLKVGPGEQDNHAPALTPRTRVVKWHTGRWKRTLVDKANPGVASGSGTPTSASSDEGDRGDENPDVDSEEDGNFPGHPVTRPGAAIPSIRQSYQYYRFIVLIPLIYLALMVVAFSLNLGSIIGKVWVSMFKATGPALHCFLLIGACIGPLKHLAVLVFAAKSHETAALQEAKQLKLRHLVVVPAYKEPVAVLRRTLESLPRKSDPETSGHDLHVILAMEATDDTHAATFDELDELFGNAFASFQMTLHTLMPCERAGKGSNENYSLRTLRADILAAGVDPWEVMVTVCDADSVFARDFFIALESAYFDQIDGRRLIYSAPRNTYRNFGKLWNPLISATECSLNSSDLLVDFAEPYVSYSNYSMLMGYAAELDFWDPEVIPEDFHMVYKAMICSHGAQSVCRVWSVISNDAVTDFHDRYEQAKRHMWGVTNIAWIAAILKHAPFSIDRIWYILLKTYMTEMSGALTPHSVLVMTFGLSLWCSPPLDARSSDAFLFLGAMILMRSLLQWVVLFAAEAWVWRRQMVSLSQHLERPSWCQVALHYGLMPVTFPLADFIFGNVACWHSVCNAFWSSEFEYVTAPKA